MLRNPPKHSHDAFLSFYLPQKTNRQWKRGEEGEGKEGAKDTRSTSPSHRSPQCRPRPMLTLALVSRSQLSSLERICRGRERKRQRQRQWEKAPKQPRHQLFQIPRIISCPFTNWMTAREEWILSLFSSLLFSILFLSFSSLFGPINSHSRFHVLVFGVMLSFGRTEVVMEVKEYMFCFARFISRLWTRQTPHKGLQTFRLKEHGSTE